MNLVVKLVIFSIIDNQLRVFLTDDKLPSKKLNQGQSLDSKARKIFGKEIGTRIGNSFVEQLYTVEGKRNIDVIYYILRHIDSIPSNKLASFIHFGKISKKIKDVGIIKYAVQRLRWKIEYTNVVYSLLPEEFTFSELQSIYEAILGRTLDKRNFHKKIFSLKILKSTKHKKMIGRARPAEMFSFKQKELSYVEIL